MSVYMIADTHFGDDAIRRYENRPFSDVKSMDQTMIDRWNRTVTPADTVYLLGDFCVKGREEALLSVLNGNIILVKGNHDTLSDEAYRAFGFAKVYDLPVLYANFWLLSHEPLYVNENMPYANVFGHVHASPQYKDLSRQHFCVSAERIDYTPVAFDEIVKRVQAAAEKEKRVQ